MELYNNDPHEGIIELSWPGKHHPLMYNGSKWTYQDMNAPRIFHALISDSTIGDFENTIGYAIKSDCLSSMTALRPFIGAQVKLVYFDAPRLNVFQSQSEQGYAKSTWLSLVKQTAIISIYLLERNGFFVLHTDEEMSHFGRLVLEEIFGKDHYVGTFAWQKQYAPQNDLNVPTDVFDYICVFSKTPIYEIEKIGPLVTPKDLKDDGDFRGCYIDGHKGARSGSESTKFKVNTSPYRWEIIESNLPQGRCHFDKILGVLYFESVSGPGDYFVTVQASDKVGNSTQKRVNFSVREQRGANDLYNISSRIWWLLKDDNDIKKGGNINISDLDDKELEAINGQEFSIVFKASGGDIFSMRSDAPGTGRYWEFGKKTLIEAIARAKASFGGNGAALPSIKKYFDRENAKKRQAIVNFLPWYDFGHTQDATQHCKALNSHGITCGPINMMAKPQKLLAYIISLFTSKESDIVLSIGDSNGVFASVANKLSRRFIHIVGGSNDDLTTWEEKASKRIFAVSQGLDNVDLENNDSIEGASHNVGAIEVLKLSKSYLSRQPANNDIVPFFDIQEDIDVFYAGLAGAYKPNADTNSFIGINGKNVVVVDEDVNPMIINSISRTFKGKKVYVVYESSEGKIPTVNNIILLRAPFELI